jgi:hypothetical protein
MIWSGWKSDIVAFQPIFPILYIYISPTLSRKQEIHNTNNVDTVIDIYGMFVTYFVENSSAHLYLILAMFDW